MLTADEMMSPWKMPPCSCALHYFDALDETNSEVGYEVHWPDQYNSNTTHCDSDSDHERGFDDYSEDPGKDDDCDGDTASELYFDNAPWRKCHCTDDDFCHYLSASTPHEAPISSFFAQVCHEAIDLCNDENDSFSPDHVKPGNYPHRAWENIRDYWREHGNWLQEWHSVPENQLQKGDFLHRVGKAMDEYYHAKPRGSRLGVRYFADGVNEVVAKVLRAWASGSGQGSLS